MSSEILTVEHQLIVEDCRIMWNQVVDPDNILLSATSRRLISPEDCEHIQNMESRKVQEKNTVIFDKLFNGCCYGRLEKIRTMLAIDYVNLAEKLPRQGESGVPLAIQASNDGLPPLPINTELPKYPCVKGLVQILLYNGTEVNGSDGYSQEVEEIMRLFQSKQIYKILKHENLTHKALTDAGEELTNGYDRFFCFILCHGNHMAVNENIKVSEILNIFKMPELGGIPKVFIIQLFSESNQEIAVTNANTDLAMTGGHDADTALYLAEEENRSSGLSFIRTTIQVLERYHRNEHLVDMMSEVIRCIVDGRGHLPKVRAYLTKKLYL